MRRFAQIVMKVLTGEKSRCYLTKRGLYKVYTGFIFLFLLPMFVYADPLTLPRDHQETSDQKPNDPSPIKDQQKEKQDEDKPRDVFDLSLAELAQVKIAVPAAFTKLTRLETPASVTIITAEDIKHTPARNIYDLIEVYVPGAIWMNFEDGPQLGIRGNIINRNFKYLLRVNGRLMNNKGHYGAKSELEQWDMGDIQRIEIIRGPGSVIYGPGAVAGVINIITHDANSAEGLSLNARYIGRYDSQGVSLSLGHKAENYNLFAYASVTHTDGYHSRNFLGSNNRTPGYVGEGSLIGEKPLDYFADYNKSPQIKLHLGIEFLDHWKFWARYTQQGSTWRGNEIKNLYGAHNLNQQGVRDRQWTATLQYDNDLRENLTISSMLSVDSSDVERRRDKVLLLDPGHVINKEINFSETEVFFRTILNWQATEQVEIALGTEYSWDSFGAGWGDSEKDFKMGENGIIVSSPSSNAVHPLDTRPWIFAKDGWRTDTMSFFSEANITLNPQLKLLISGRTDKNTHSDWLYSWRTALIDKIDDDQTIKIIAQQSQRMSTAGQLFALDRNNKNPESETLTGIEVIYSACADKPLSFSLSGFWNDTEIIAWNQASQSTSPVGDLRLAGFDAEIRYKWSFGEVGASYSLVKQLDWDLADGVSASGISYSEYNQQLRGTNAFQRGVGNDLNNWPNQAFKFYARVDLTKRLTLHIDGRLIWDYQGSRDGLKGLANAISGLPVYGAVSSALGRVKDAGAYDYDFRLNASLTYDYSENLTLQVFAQNLIGRDGNKRYSYDAGNNKLSPSRVRFIEEPRTIGVSIRYQF